MHQSELLNYAAVPLDYRCQKTIADFVSLPTQSTTALHLHQWMKKNVAQQEKRSTKKPSALSPIALQHPAAGSGAKQAPANASAATRKKSAACEKWGRANNRVEAISHNWH